MAPKGKAGSDERDGVSLTNLDQPLFPEANATKRDLVDYLDAMSGPMLAVRPAYLVRLALEDSGLAGAVKTSGA
jgi:DNA primase